jgi:hypothetical protein
VSRSDGRAGRPAAVEEPLEAPVEVGVPDAVVPGVVPAVPVARGDGDAAPGSEPGAEHAASVAAAAATPRNARRPSTVGAGWCASVASGSVGSGAVTGAGWHRNL